LEVTFIPSARIEDYLEEIFAVEAQGRSATVTSLAEVLSVTKGTVVSALHRLAEEGLLTHERYGSPALTEAGRERALRIFRRHEYMTQLFFGVLGIERRRAEAMACGLEHDMDEEAEGRLMVLADFLSRGIREGAPWVSELEAALSDPLSLPCPLSLLTPGEGGVVARVTAEGVLKKRLLEMGLVPETPVVFLRSSPLGDPLEMEVRGMRLSLRRSEAATVWVRRCAEN
jgi:DtxR family Mn-dependent transcriptional regulator